MNYDLLPEGLRDGMRRYVEHGIEPGSFLRACLENKLVESFGQADISNRLSMFHICDFLYNEMSPALWGSPESVADWIRIKDESRRAWAQIPVKEPHAETRSD